MRVVVLDVLEVDLGSPDGVPGVPGDLEDHEGDREADDRVGDLRAERDDDRARDDGERDEAVDAGVVSVGGHRRAPEPPPRRQAHPRRELVADKADDAGRGEHPQVGQVLRVDEALDRHVERDAGGDEDRENDREPGESLAAHAAQKERDPERDRGQGIAEVVDQVGQQRDRA